MIVPMAPDARAESGCLSVRGTDEADPPRANSTAWPSSPRLAAQRAAACRSIACIVSTCRIPQRLQQRPLIHRAVRLGREGGVATIIGKRGVHLRCPPPQQPRQLQRLGNCRRDRLRRLILARRAPGLARHAQRQPPARRSAYRAARNSAAHDRGTLPMRRPGLATYVSTTASVRGAAVANLHRRRQAPRCWEIRPASGAARSPPPG